MKSRKARRLVYIAAVLATIRLLAGCAPDDLTPAESGAPTPTPTPTTVAADDMRGVWLSYLDLAPMLAGGEPAAAEAALEAAFDLCAAKGINTVFFHVRAHGDAYYPSAVYPAAADAAALLSRGFDPLACAVRAAHARGLALHAWINPYRIGEDRAAAVAAIDGEAPAVFQNNGVWYYDPADAAARRLVLAGVRELLVGYAVDGIHFDDYFYPAGLSAQGEDFEAIPAGTDVGDWRRTQVDILISGVYGLAHQYGRLFGVSPIGLIEKCRTSAYADTALWMSRPGYIDYICPQLYFGFANTAHPYPEALSAWLALPRRSGLKVYVGLALYKAGLEDDPYAGGGRQEWCTARDILARQAAAAQATGQTSGYVLFRYAQLTAADGAAAEEYRNLQAAAAAAE